MHSVYPYHVYKDGTMALCNVYVNDRLGTFSMAPCTVVSHLEDNNRGDGQYIYQVVLKINNHHERMVVLPQMRVQRLFKEAEAE